MQLLGKQSGTAISGLPMFMARRAVGVRSRRAGFGPRLRRGRRDRAKRVIGKRVPLGLRQWLRFYALRGRTPNPYPLRLDHGDAAGKSPEMTIPHEVFNKRSYRQRAKAPRAE